MNIDFKYKLCHYMKYCYDNNYNTIRDGNISIRKFNDNNKFYISPGSVKKNNLIKDDIIEYDIINNKTLESKNNLNPSGETQLHLNIYNDMKDINSIVHCHPQYILAFIGVYNKTNELSEIKKIFKEINPNIKIAPNVPEIKARTIDLANLTLTHLNSCKDGNDTYNIVALKNHGIVSVGKTIEEALEYIETLEYYCKIALLSI